jgi:hypothetical protein
MSNRKVRLAAVGCLVLGVLVAVARAQNVQEWQVTTALFSVQAQEVALVNVSLLDQRGAPQARFVLRLFDENGVVVARREEMLEAGKSFSIRYTGPRLVRAVLDMTETTTLLLSAKRRPGLGVDLNDTITGGTRHIPSYDPVPIGRN